MRIKAQNITQENFTAFGKVVKAPKGEPTSKAKDYKFWSNIASYMIDGETEIGICTVYMQPVMQISGIERHMRTPEILIPIDAPFILPLAKENNSGDVIEAFHVNIGEAVVMNKAVWHGPCLPVGKNESSYFVIFRKNTPHEDVEKKATESVEIVI